MCPKWGRSPLLGLVILFFAEPTAHAQDHRPTVVVYVYNNAKVTESVLAESGRYVQEMFDKAGIELVWLNSMARIAAGETDFSPSASGPVTVTYVSVVIVPRPDMIAPKNRKSEARMGWTPGNQHIRTYIFYEPVEAFVLNNFPRIHVLRVPRLLTYVVAHELGHLLLPLVDAHSEKGIMKWQLDRSDLAELFSNTLGFSSEEARLMREEIQRRARVTQMTH